MIYRPFPLPLADLFSSATFITHFRSHLATFKIPPSFSHHRAEQGGGGDPFVDFNEERHGVGGKEGGAEVWLVGRDWKVRIFFFRFLTGWHEFRGWKIKGG